MSLDSSRARSCSRPSRPPPPPSPPFLKHKLTFAFARALCRDSLSTTLPARFRFFSR